MIRSNPSLLIALATLAIFPISSLAQGLSPSEYQARRRELRQEFIAASSPSQKRAILEEFRRLELAQGNVPESGGNDRDDGDSTATPPVAATNALDSNAVENPPLAEALSRGLLVMSGSTSQTPPPFSIGLGTEASQWIDAIVQTAVKTARLQQLIAETRRELSSDLWVPTGILAGSSAPWFGQQVRDLVEERETYLSWRQETMAWLAEGIKPDRALSEEELNNWSEALANTAGYRKFFGPVLAAHYAWERGKWEKQLAIHQRRLQRQIQAYQRVREAMEKAREIRETTAFVLKLKEAHDLIGNLLSGLENPATIPNSAINILFSKLDKTGDAIEKNIATITGYAVKVTVLLEGYDSIAALERSLSNTIRNIQRARTAARGYHQSYRRALQMGNAYAWKR